MLDLDPRRDREAQSVWMITEYGLNSGWCILSCIGGV